MTDPRPFRVPFVCTHDSARSPMAEAILRREGGERFVVESAGSEPWSVVHPIAPLFIEGLGGAPVGSGRLATFRRAQPTLTRRIERLLPGPEEASRSARRSGRLDVDRIAGAEGS